MSVRSALRPAPPVAHVVPLAGVPWPVYKLESLVLAAMVALVLAVVTGSAQVAVLVAAAAATLRWAAGTRTARRLSQSRTTA
ncbi:MAG: hypothetical protein J2P18_05565 [Nocardia sp.]|nr:hypothetical protein [Nocardia sp.]